MSKKRIKFDKSQFIFFLHSINITKMFQWKSYCTEVKYAYAICVCKTLFASLLATTALKS